MRKSIKLFVLLISLTACISCGPKAKQDDLGTDSTAVSQEASDATKRAEDIAAKRARLEAARIEKAEQRRLAAIEAAKTSPTYKDASGKIIYYITEVSPAYPGGDEAMVKYLNDNLKYPEEARSNGVEGTVFVDFVVSENGQVREIAATDVIGDEIDQSLKDEAVRVVAAMPAWVAGKQNGKAVDTKYSIPITFQLM